MSNKLYATEDYEVVISGISGLFPLSRNIHEFESYLYSKVNMVTNDDFGSKYTKKNIPAFSGKIPDLSGFDSTFFGIHQMQADNMDPQSRLLIEESFKCVMDAGVNPSNIRGENIGVYIGACVSETESFLYYNQNIPSGFGITGCSKAMFANRVSYSLGLTGPSLLCDTACSSSTYGINLAYRAIKSGEITSAIVGGSNLCLHPNYTMQYNHLGMLTQDGLCCPFDDEANGYARSEAVACIFLQRKCDAKRVYASLVNCDTNCDGYKPDGITSPSAKQQEILMNSFYSSCGFDLNDLGYLEAHGAGTATSDIEECKAIDNAICKKRNQSLLIGSVKSNCGHTEPASGITSIIKVIFAMQNNLIPPTLNFKTPKKEIDALISGRLLVAVEPTPLPKPYVAVNSFAIGGANAHVLLHQFEKCKNLDKLPELTFPRLITWSARTEANLNLFFNDLEKRPLDVEYLALVQSAQRGGIQGMVFRGYSIFMSRKGEFKQPLLLSKKIQHYGGVKRPLVWVFSGMGSQWVGMGKHLLQIPLACQSIQRSHNILKPSGLNLLEIVSSSNPHMFDNILHSFVGIAAIQIALVDILRALDIVPDFIIGHSVGELGCAYADNCITAEQMILAAYYRGKVSLMSDKIKGSMAAVGLNFSEVKAMLPESIEVACHNSLESCTISGPSEDIKEFVEVLRKKNVFAKEVQCSNIAFHSRYIAQFGAELLKYLKHVIPQPVQRSNKWISTSVPRSKWLSSESKYSSAEYHTNNLLSCVLFEEAITFVPKNSITVEIAPHSLLQSILKNSIPNAVHVALTRRNADDDDSVLLNALGDLYLNGIELNIEKLYPQVNWPVSRGTASLSHLIEFDHSGSCFVFKFNENLVEKGTETFFINENRQHFIWQKTDSHVLLPESWYLVCVWRTFAGLKGALNFEDLIVEFENVNFVRTMNSFMRSQAKVVVSIQKGSGKFEITESQNLIAYGTIRESDKLFCTDFNVHHNPSWIMTNDQFYQELRLCGYNYNSNFMVVEMVSSDCTNGQIKWNGDWVTFIDGIMQFDRFEKRGRNLDMLTRIRFLRINAHYHREHMENNIAKAYKSFYEKRIIGGGVEIVELTSRTTKQRASPLKTKIMRHEFISYDRPFQTSIENIASCCIEMLTKNFAMSFVKVLDLASNKFGTAFSNALIEALDELPEIGRSLTIENTLSNSNESDGKLGDANIVISAWDDYVKNLCFLSAKGLLLLRIKIGMSLGSGLEKNHLLCIAEFATNNENIIVLKKSESQAIKNEIVINASEIGSFVKKLSQIERSINNILLVCENGKISGLLKLFKALKRRPRWSLLRCLIIQDVKAPSFNESLSFYEKRLCLGLSVNILKEGNWGDFHWIRSSQEAKLTTPPCSIYASVGEVGSCGTLGWVQGPNLPKEYVKVAYSSINFRDVLIAHGILSTNVQESEFLETESLFGMEFSGIDIENRTEVMGMTFCGSLSSFTRTDNPLIWNIPKQWSLKEAATVPLAYVTVYYAFFSVVNILRGESILIHAGYSSIGIAAIRTAVAYGLQVFTTVSSKQQKRQFLTLFPEFNETHVLSYKNSSFEDMLLEVTNGNGVRYVLNSFSGKKLFASLRCLRTRGQFLDLSDIDIFNNQNLGLGVFLNEISFHAVNLKNLKRNDWQSAKIIKQRISEDIEKGIIQPLPSTIFEGNEIEKAFDFMSKNRGLGKAIIKIPSDFNVDKDISSMQFSNRAYFDPRLVYIVSGGLSIFGRNLVTYLVKRGARKIFMNSVCAAQFGWQEFCSSVLKAYGCSISLTSSNIESIEESITFISSCKKSGLVGGIFCLFSDLSGLPHLDGDEMFDLETVTKHIRHIKNLDEVSRRLCATLEHFIVFANASSKNYEIESSFVAEIIETRNMELLPSKLIQVDLNQYFFMAGEDLNTENPPQTQLNNWSDMFDRVICYDGSTVSFSVNPEKVKARSLVSAHDFILKFMKTPSDYSFPNNVKFMDMGMDSLTANEISEELRTNFNIELSVSEMKNLSLYRFINIVNGSTELFEAKAVPKAKYECIFKELLGDLSYDFINESTFIKINNISLGDPVLIFPGINDCKIDLITNLGSQLLSPAYIIRLQQSSLSNLKYLTEYLCKEIESFLKEKKCKQFKIIAHSFGTVIAHLTIEMLEESGLKGTAVYIGSSPLVQGQAMDMLLSAYTISEIENKILAAIIYSVLPHLKYNDIEKDLVTKINKESREQYIRSLCRQYHDCTLQNIPLFSDIVIKKMRILREFTTSKFSSIIKAKLLILKPTKSALIPTDETYGLSPFARNAMISAIIEGDHETLFQSLESSKAINRFFVDSFN